jgi:hypothetical protein
MAIKVRDQAFLLASGMDSEQLNALHFQACQLELEVQKQRDNLTSRLHAARR